MAQVQKRETVPINTEDDVVLVRQSVRRWAGEMSFGLVDQTKIVTAASELARNTLVYGRGGAMEMEALMDGNRRGLRLTFEDQGPGIPDPDLALRDGYTTGGGLGLGLSGARRLVNEFNLHTSVGEGTRITVVRWK